MPLLNANVGCPGGPHGFHGPHMAAQRLLLGALGAAYGCSEAPYGCPWGSIWLLRGCIWLQRGCILLHRGRLWLPCGRYAVYAASGWAGLGSRTGEKGQLRVARAVWAPNDSQQWRPKIAKCIQGSRLRIVNELMAAGLPRCLGAG